ncbi:MAG: PASTA domain-containing protein [Gemmatimonadaceae bacterium]|jgi:hypothetical protein|nr:PASTA domain-containing protein [Gemmatimonadaceae bacterium]
MAPRSVWGKRVLLTIVAGVVTGLGSAVVGLRILEGDAPPRPALSEPEPEPVVEAPVRRTARGPRADGMRNGEEGLVGGGAMATRDSVAVVPDLIGRVEGDARRLLERAGFTVGDIMFREDDNPVGTVLQTYPVPGERVTLPATVNLILADRRRVLLPDDTLLSPPDPDSIVRSTDSLIVRPDSLP